MSTAVEVTYTVACIVAEGVRQSSKAAALATYAAAGFAGTALAAFRTALLAADDAYVSAVQTAAAAGGVAPQPNLSQPIYGLSQSAFVQATPGIQGGGE